MHYLPCHPLATPLIFQAMTPWEIDSKDNRALHTTPTRIARLFLTHSYPPTQI